MTPNAYKKTQSIKVETIARKFEENEKATRRQRDKDVGNKSTIEAQRLEEIQ